MSEMLFNITKDLDRIRRTLDVQQIEITSELNRSKSYLSKIVARSEKLTQDDAVKYLFFLLRTARRKILSIDHHKRDILQSCINELMKMMESLEVTLDWQRPYSRIKPDSPNFFFKRNMEERFLDGLRDTNNDNFTSVVKGAPLAGKTSALLWAAYIAHNSGVKHILTINMNYVFADAKIGLLGDENFEIEKFSIHLHETFYKTLALQVIDLLYLDHDSLGDKALEFSNQLDNLKIKPENVMRSAIHTLLKNASAMLIIDGIDLICLQSLPMISKRTDKKGTLDQFVVSLLEPIVVHLRKFTQHDTYFPGSKSLSVLVSFTFDELWPKIQESSFFQECDKIFLKTSMSEEDMNEFSDIFDLGDVSYPILRRLIGAHPFLVHVLLYEFARYKTQNPSTKERPEDWLDILMHPVSKDKIVSPASIHLRKIAEAYKRYGDAIRNIATNIKTLLSINESDWPEKVFWEKKESLFNGDKPCNDRIMRGIANLFKGRESYQKMLVESGILPNDISGTQKEYFPFISKFHASCFYDKGYLCSLDKFANT